MTKRNCLKYLLFCSLLSVIQSGCVAPQPHVVPLPPVVPESIPRELAKVSLPDYVLEPPDVLAIDAIDVIPLPPYRLNSLDTISINVEGMPPDREIRGEYTIEPGGIVSLGFEYGSVKVGGQTVDEAQARITEHLINKDVLEPEVSVALANIRSEQDIAGEHLVAPDGKVNLGIYGRVRVVGMTIEEATAAIESHLSQFLENPKVAVDVYAYNSKVYYIISQGGGLGDQVFPIPVKGNETVLDAISQINGLQSFSSKKIWIARPGSNRCGGDQILPVDWLSITQRGDVSTNYQVLPGDRVYVAEDKFVALDNGLAKILAPFERIFGFTLLGTSAVQRLDFYEEFGRRGGIGGF